VSSEEGTPARLARHLAGAVRPLELAFRDPAAFRALLFQLGWEVPGLPPSYVTVADAAVQAADFLEALADDPTLDEALDVIVKAGDVYRAVGALTEAPAGIDPAAFLPELARRLAELLLAQELLAEAPGWFATLEALGIIGLEDTPPATAATAGMRSAASKSPPSPASTSPTPPRRSASPAGPGPCTASAGAP